MRTKQIATIGLFFNLVVVIVVYTLISLVSRRLFQSLLASGLALFMSGALFRYFARKTLVAPPSEVDRDAAALLLAIGVLPGVVCAAGYLYLVFDDPDKSLSWPFLVAPLLMGTTVVQLWGEREA